MKTFFYTTLHIVYIFFLVIYGTFAVAIFSNPSAGATFPLNPVNMGLLIFLLLFLVANYIYQLKKKKWITFLIGSLVYISIFLFVLLVIYPLLYKIFNYT